VQARRTRHLAGPYPPGLPGRPQRWNSVCRSGGVPRRHSAPGTGFRKQAHRLAGTFETIGVEQAMCSSATMHHAWRSLTPMVWAASTTLARRRITPFNTCSLACSFWFNVNHLVD